MHSSGQSPSEEQLAALIRSPPPLPAFLLHAARLAFIMAEADSRSSSSSTSAFPSSSPSSSLSEVLMGSMTSSAASLPSQSASSSLPELDDDDDELDEELEELQRDYGFICILSSHIWSYLSQLQ